MIRSPDPRSVNKRGNIIKLSFLLSVDYPFGHLVQGDHGDVEVEVSDEEYELIRRWIYEDAEPDDFPELQRVWDLLYAAGRELLEDNKFADDPDTEHGEPDDLEITIQPPDVDISDLDHDVE